MAFEQLPKDSMMLLSFVNTRLRDDKIDLSEFALSFGVEVNEIKKKLATIDYTYDENLNRFV